MKLKETLKNKLTKKQLQEMGSAFDVVGDIAIIDIPDSLIKKEKLIGETLIKLNKHVEVACKKVGIHHGKFRLQKYKIIAGKRRKTTIYKENNVFLKLHIEKTYFSPRLSTERKRVMLQCKKGEEVLIMFSGVAPYCCVIAKNSEVKQVYGVEINKNAHEFALENIKLNKLNNVKLYNGDVRKVVPRLRKKFDRIAMPLPKSAEDFLDIALKSIKKKGIIHFYDFLHENEFGEARRKIKDACKKAGLKYKTLNFVKCGHFGPKIYRICIDFQII